MTMIYHVFGRIVAIYFFILEEVFPVENTKSEPTVKHRKNLLVIRTKK